jgi:threonine dehydratase
MPFDIRNEVLDAEKRIRKYIRETPVESSPYLSQLGNCQAHFKLENNQITGSFKLRGAVNKFLSLSADERKEDVITASSGNHAAAFAHVLDKFSGHACFD